MTSCLIDLLTLWVTFYLVSSLEHWLPFYPFWPLCLIDIVPCICLSCVSYINHLYTILQDMILSCLPLPSKHTLNRIIYLLVNMLVLFGLHTILPLLFIRSSCLNFWNSLKYMRRTWQDRVRLLYKIPLLSCYLYADSHRNCWIQIPPD